MKISLTFYSMVASYCQLLINYMRLSPVFKKFATQKQPFHKLKSQAARRLPEFPYPWFKYFYIKPIGLELVQEIEIHISTDNYSKKFNTNLILYRYVGMLLHVWFLRYRLHQEVWHDFNKGLSFKAWRITRSLNKLLEQYTKDHVYQYDQNFNIKAYYELKRIQKAMFWSLDDYFIYDFREKPLEQIIQEDICLQNESEQLFECYLQYMQSTVNYLSTLSIDQLLQEHIDWK